MIQIHKKEPPELLVDFIRKNPSATYDSDSFKPLRIMLREHLLKEQKYLCAYCCCSINTDSSHNEHIEPQKQGGIQSKRSLDYCNIVASCNKKNTCGRHKGNIYDEKLFISPLSPECNDRFSYDPNGFICGDQYTIDLLNLNDYQLRSARKAVFRTIMEMEQEDIELVFCSDPDVYCSFYNIIQWYLGHF